MKRCFIMFIILLLTLVISAIEEGIEEKNSAPNITNKEIEPKETFTSKEMANLTLKQQP